ncbi:DsbA family protein [Bosea sp. (in: a-proteobacteria)]|uniref:DsbA family protein n=1 Tax=Bosea sp. (in: a-proteobacteria) TaxID=1871050 RepID=UPI002FC867BA
MNRRTALLRLAASGFAITSVPALLAAGPALAVESDANAVFNDPEAPNAGNPKGDVTIAAFLDYNCPYCKKAAPDLRRIVKTDGKIRLVYKDWPILGDASVYGAQLALGAHYQGKYEAVHHALMALPSARGPKEKILQAVQAAGVDMARLQADLDGKADAITALLRRNLAQADAIGLEGTPAYLVGPFRTSTLNYDGFKQVVADARARQAAK